MNYPNSPAFERVAARMRRSIPDQFRGVRLAAYPATTIKVAVPPPFRPFYDHCNPSLLKERFDSPWYYDSTYGEAPFISHLDPWVVWMLQNPVWSKKTSGPATLPGPPTSISDFPGTWNDLRQRIDLSTSAYGSRRWFLPIASMSWDDSWEGYRRLSLFDSSKTAKLFSLTRCALYIVRCRAWLLRTLTFAIKDDPSVLHNLPAQFNEELLALLQSSQPQYISENPAYAGTSLTCSNSDDDFLWLSHANVPLWEKVGPVPKEKGVPLPKDTAPSPEDEHLRFKTSEVGGWDLSRQNYGGWGAPSFSNDGWNSAYRPPSTSEANQGGWNSNNLMAANTSGSQNAFQYRPDAAPVPSSKPPSHARKTVTKTARKMDPAQQAKKDAKEAKTAKRRRIAREIQEQRGLNWDQAYDEAGAEMLDEELTLDLERQDSEDEDLYPPLGPARPPSPDSPTPLPAAQVIPIPPSTNPLPPPLISDQPMTNPDDLLSPPPSPMMGVSHTPIAGTTETMTEPPPTTIDAANDQFIGISGTGWSIHRRQGGTSYAS
jgi:hypothetical protein